MENTFSIPGLGLFGPTEFDSLPVKVCGSVSGVRLVLRDPAPETLNLKKIEFCRDGKVLELDPAMYTLAQSSVYADKGPELLLSGDGIHTCRELSPFWSISFAAPVNLDEIRVLNRGDKWSMRSRTLAVEITDERGNVKELYRPDSAEELLRKIYASIPELGEAPVPGRGEVIARLIRAATDGKLAILEIDWRVLAQLIDVWNDSTDLSDDEIALLALYLLAQRQRGPKTSLSFFSPILKTRVQLRRLEEHINKFAQIYGLKRYVLTRHGMSPATLMEQAPGYVAGLRKVMGAIETLGYRSFICYGTLLGAARTGTFIPHDDDVDIAYVLEATTRDEMIVEIAQVKAKLEAMGFFVGIVPFQSNMHVRLPDGKSIDLFPCWHEGCKVQFFMERMIQRGIATDIVFPIGSVALYGEPFAAPNDVSGFLSERYGTGWSISDQYYEWPWPLLDAAPVAPSPETKISLAPPAVPALVQSARSEIVVERLLSTNKNTGLARAVSKVGADAVSPTPAVSAPPVQKEGAVQLNWWRHEPNFSDLLSPWLVRKITGKEVQLNSGETSVTHLAIGSVIDKATPKTVVWGSGAFGCESPGQLCKDAEYRAVRGPLTRNALRVANIECPEVYGDPALLLPHFYNPSVKKTHELGVVIRWSETQWHDFQFGDGVKKIYLGSDDVEGLLDAILSCKKIVSSSLHGLILADAYGIPSAWMESGTPTGLHFKYYDYFLSVNKVRRPQHFEPSSSQISLVDLLTEFEFDGRRIEFDADALLKACPWNQ